MTKYKEYLANSVMDFLVLIFSQEFISDTTIFRGHSNKEWELIPEIGRSNMFNLLEGYEDWKTFEEDIFERFAKYAIPYLNKEPKNEIEWAVIGRHHGLPTRLLDWTKNPLKGLYFAVEDTTYNNDSAVWVLDDSGCRKGIKNFEIVDKYPGSGFDVYFPDQIDNRLIVQEGCFTIHAFPKKNIPLVPIEKCKGITELIKIIIPFSKKKEIKFDLDKLGVNRRTLFPDLDGLAKYICWEFSLLMNSTSIL